MTLGVYDSGEAYRIFLELPVLRKVVIIGVNLHYGDAEKTGYGDGSENHPGKKVRMIYRHRC